MQAHRRAIVGWAVVLVAVYGTTAIANAETLRHAGIERATMVLLPAALTAEHPEHILDDESPEALTRARRRQAGELLGG